MIRAVCENDLATLRACLCPPRASVNFESGLLLRAAVRRGFEGIVSALLSAGANPAKRKCVAFRMAVSDDRVAMASRLVDALPERALLRLLEEMGEQQRGTWHVGLLRRRRDELCWQRSVRGRNARLCRAVKASDTVAVAQCLRNRHKSVNCDRGTPLRDAVCSGDIDIVRMLLDAGAHPEKTDGAALVAAAARGYASILEVLLPATRRLTSRVAENVLRAAVEHHYPKCIEVLVPHLSRVSDPRACLWSALWESMGKRSSTDSGHLCAPGGDKGGPASPLSEDGEGPPPLVFPNPPPPVARGSLADAIRSLERYVEWRAKTASEMPKEEEDTDKGGPASPASEGDEGPPPLVSPGPPSLVVRAAAAADAQAIRSLQRYGIVWPVKTARQLQKEKEDTDEWLRRGGPSRLPSLW